MTDESLNFLQKQKKTEDIEKTVKMSWIFDNLFSKTINEEEVRRFVLTFRRLGQCAMVVHRFVQFWVIK